MTLAKTFFQKLLFSVFHRKFPGKDVDIVKLVASVTGDITPEEFNSYCTVVSRLFRAVVRVVSFFLMLWRGVLI